MFEALAGARQAERNGERGRGDVRGSEPRESPRQTFFAGNNRSGGAAEAGRGRRGGAAAAAGIFCGKQTLGWGEDGGEAQQEVGADGAPGAPAGTAQPGGCVQQMGEVAMARLLGATG
ncbi:MAG: hypothetical protein U9R72_02240 [Chloroflexota bacterium]|nr:hypothetical protein [Chloroflexota bacterium]